MLNFRLEFMRGLKNVVWFLFVGVLSVNIVSCDGASENENVKLTNAELAADLDYVNDFTVSSEKSNVAWNCEMMGLYGHSGIVSIKEGEFRTFENQVIGGALTIDMKSMRTTDDNKLYVNGSRQDLLGHLKSPEFFDVSEFPEAKFVITEIFENSIIGDLTIKGITFEEKLEMVEMTQSRLGLEVSGLLVFNRQDYDVYYNHPMKDMIISDDVVLHVVVVGEESGKEQN